MDAGAHARGVQRTSRSRCNLPLYIWPG